MTDSPDNFKEANDLFHNEEENICSDGKKGKARNVFIGKLKNFLQ